MKNIIYIWIVLLFAACYEDKGNYDYNEINNLTVANVDSTYTIDQFDTLKINPDLKGSQYENEDLFDYEWEIDKKIVGVEKVLVYKVNLAPSVADYYCRLIMTDRNLKTKTFFQFELKVSSATAGDAIIVLSNYKNRAELSLQRLKEGSPFAVNYYLDVAGRPLGTGPKRLYQHFRTIDTKGNPSYLDVNYGFQVLTNEGLKAIEHDKMVEGESPAYIDESFFTRINPGYLPLVFTDYKVEGVVHSIIDYGSAFGETDIGSAIRMISGGRYYFLYHTFTGNLSLTTNLGSPYGGYLCPVTFLAYQTPNTGSLLGSPNRGYIESRFRLMFDQTYGRFTYRNFVSDGLVAIDESEIPAYPGYDLQYASHTRDKNFCIAVLNSGNNIKLLLLKVPGTLEEKKGTGDVPPMPFAVLGEMDISSQLINEKSCFYNMAYEPYTFFTTNNMLYRFNTLNLQAGSGPDSSPVASLTDYGYGNDAEITCMCFSRSEKSIILGVSRYGGDIQGMSDELKGDIVVIDAVTYQLKNKYQGISGYPKDVIVKYQSYYRDGKNNSNVLLDNI